jgi:flagellar biosynthetic protein FlhB
MSEQDQEQKTEQPTQKKLDDAHKRGDVARSQELKHWFMLLGGTAAVGLFAAPAAFRVGTAMAPFLSDAGRIDADPGHLMAVGWNVAAALTIALALPMLALIAAALIGGLIQHRPVLTAAKLKPELSRISPLAGLKRLGSIQGLVEYAKSLIKILVVAAVLARVLWPERARLESLVSLDPVALLGLTQHLAVKLFTTTLIIMGIVAGADFAWQRFQMTKRLRMSRQELRDEMKQSDGDPLIKAKIRQLRNERARRRMMAAVPDATVIIANPTHYAVALRYDADAMAAPRCVAKGVDALALRIRAVAEEAGVPVVENPPLARALHATVEIDRDIPPEHYRAVAQVIGYVMQIKAGPPGGPAAMHASPSRRDRP